jgi:hypothetical protein
VKHTGDITCRQANECLGCGIDAERAAVLIGKQSYRLALLQRVDRLIEESGPVARAAADEPTDTGNQVPGVMQHHAFAIELRFAVDRKRPAWRVFMVLTHGSVKDQISGDIKEPGDPGDTKPDELPGGFGIDAEGEYRVTVAVSNRGKGRRMDDGHGPGLPEGLGDLLGVGEFHRGVMRRLVAEEGTPPGRGPGKNLVSSLAGSRNQPPSKIA